MADSFTSKYGPWALVTGASSGIGLAFATALASRGLNVALTARRRDRLQELAESLSREHGVETKVIVADLFHGSSYAHIESEISELDIGLFINNAGVLTVGSFFRANMDTHLNLVDVNVRATTALVHIFGWRLAEPGWGGVIFVSSVGQLPGPWVSSYGASKSFVSTLSVVLEHELRRKGVDVLWLEPGAVTSEMYHEAAKVVDFAKLGMPVMAAAECVDDALRKLKRGGRWTPGLANRVLFGVGRWLPERLRMTLGRRFVGRAIKKEIQEF